MLNRKEGEKKGIFVARLKPIILGSEHYLHRHRGNTHRFIQPFNGGDDGL